MSKYIIDSNVLIEAHRNYYSFDFGNSFWNQLEKFFKSKDIVVLKVVRDEILHGADDSLAKWMKSVEIYFQPFIATDTEQFYENYSKILNYVQNCGLYKKIALTNWSNPQIADPCIIVVAMQYNYTILTNEKSVGKITNPSKNARIPDVAKHFGVECMRIFDFMRKKRFRL